MKRKIISIICLAIIVCSILNVYATPSENTNTNFIKIDDTVEIDKSINMTLILDNISYDNFIFKLYSSETLENVNANNIDLKNFNNEEISFDYCINCSSLKTITLNYKLPTNVEVGNKITFNIALINKDNEEEYVTVRKTVTVIESVKKEEEEIDKDKDKDKQIPEDEKKDMNKKNSFSRSSFNFSGNISSSTPKTTNNVSTKYMGSSNNYLSNISVKGYSLNKKFTKERLTYFVTVPNNVKSINVSASKENSNATINISGTSNLIVGVNKVLVSVTAQDGRVKNYRIYVTRLDSDNNEKQD